MLQTDSDALNLRLLLPSAQRFGRPPRRPPAAHLPLPQMPQAQPGCSTPSLVAAAALTTSRPSCPARGMGPSSSPDIVHRVLRETCHRCWTCCCCGTHSSSAVRALRMHDSPPVKLQQLRSSSRPTAADRGVWQGSLALGPELSAKERHHLPVNTACIFSCMLQELRQR